MGRGREEGKKVKRERLVCDPRSGTQPSLYVSPEYPGVPPVVPRDECEVGEGHPRGDIGGTVNSRVEAQVQRVDL